MITLTLRKEISDSNKIIGTELTKLQKALYADDWLEHYKDNNEKIRAFGFCYGWMQEF